MGTRRRPTAVEPPGAELASAVKALAEDVPHLVREELALAKLEAKLAAVKAGILGAVGVVALLGAFFLALGASLLVSQVTERPWLGPVAVGGGLLVIAGIIAPIVLERSSRRA